MRIIKYLLLCLLIPSVCLAGGMQPVGGITVAYSGAADVTGPEISSGTAPAIDEAGTTLTITFTEACVEGASYDDADWTLSCSTTGPLTIAHNGGTATAWDMDITGGPVQESGTDTCTLDWAGTANGVEDASGNDLSAIDPPESVTNNSTQSASDFEYEIAFDNTTGWTVINGGAWTMNGTATPPSGWDQSLVYSGGALSNANRQYIKAEVITGGSNEYVLLLRVPSGGTGRAYGLDFEFGSTNATVSGINSGLWVESFGSANTMDQTITDGVWCGFEVEGTGSGTTTFRGWTWTSNPGNRSAWGPADFTITPSIGHLSDSATYFGIQSGQSADSEYDNLSAGSSASAP